MPVVNTATYVMYKWKGWLNYCRIIPAPLVNISKTYQKSGNGEIVGKLYTLTLTGTLVAWMGSPQSKIDVTHDDTGFDSVTGYFYFLQNYPPDEAIDSKDRLSAIQRKQEAIRYLFSQEGGDFEIQSAGGQSPVKCNPRILDISFTEGIWFDRCDYTITLECDELYGLGDYSTEDSLLQYISDANEEWTIDTNEESAETFGIPRSYSVSHTISAQGKRFFDENGDLIKQPWQQARTFVQSKLSSDDSVLLTSSEASGIPSYYAGYNHSRNENIDKQGGSYSITETWVLTSGNAIESFSVQTVDSLENPYTQVTINGEVRGYDERDANLNIVSAKYDNADTKFVKVSGLALTRAQQFSGLSLNILPISQTIGKNPMQGLITYDFEYDNRPSNFVEHAKSELISIEDSIGGESFAAVFVLGRSRGPVLQNLGTKPVNTRTLNIELTLYPETGTAQELINDKKPTNNPLYATDIATIVAAAKPATAYGWDEDYTFQDQVFENWDFKNWHYTYKTTWSFEAI